MHMTKLWKETGNGTGKIILTRRIRLKKKKKVLNFCIFFSLVWFLTRLDTTECLTLNMCSHLFPFMQKGIRTAFQKTLAVYKCFWNIHEIWFCHCRSVFERQVMLHLLISAYFSNSRYVIVLSKISLKIISLSERNNNSKFLEVIPKQCRDFLKKLLLTFKNLCLKKKKSASLLYWSLQR